MHGRQAIAIALLVAALAVAGCGLGPGDDLGQVGVTVTRDFGAEQVVAPVSDDVTESDTVMRVLERNAEITTRYGGGFVQSIDGLEGDYGGGSSLDWFFYVNGVESTVGAADVQLQGGEAVWWDYHDWSAATSIPAVVGSWPQPFVGGYEGHEHPTVVECRGGGGACADGGSEAAGRRGDADLLRERRRARSGSWSAPGPGSSRMRPPRSSSPGPRAAVSTPDSRRAADGEALVGLDQGGEEARRFGPAAGLVAATRRGGAPPTWIVTGVNMRGVDRGRRPARRGLPA